MAVVSNPNSYITRKELIQTLGNYVEKSFVLDYMHSELEDSLDNLNIYTKNEINKTLENYITKSEVQNILNNNVEYYTKDDTRNLINSAINAFKNVDLPSRLGNYITKSEVSETLNNLFYSKSEIDSKLEQCITSNNNTILETFINNALIGYSTTQDIRSMLVSAINTSAKQLEAKVNTILSSYVSKESINEVIKKLNDSNNLLENTFIDYYNKEQTNDRINYLIKNYCYTREETRQLIQISIDFFKNNYLESKLDDYVTKETYTDNLKNYYTKTQIDDKLDADNLCNIMHLTEASYNLLVKRNQIQENCIYILYKFNRPVSIFIGSLHLAKRNTTGSIGFPYTFPITF
jgi:hypothetical protein